MPRSTCFASLLLTFSPFSITLADVAALGRIEPHQGIMSVSAPVILEAGNGILLKSLNVAVGDEVRQDQMLATTESEAMLKAIRDRAGAALELAQNEFNAADADAHAACVRAAVSRREADRRQSLLGQNLSSLEESERASADAEFQEASCHAATMQSHARQAAVAVAEKELRLREVLLSRAYVRAPANGTVLQINAWPGEAIGPRGVLELGRTENMYAIAEVYETDISRVSVGQKATVTSSAFDGPLRGVVEIIRPMVRKQDVMGTDPAASKDARIIEVEILLDEPERVKQLSNLQVEVLIEE